jgi:hypothetical protein
MRFFPLVLPFLLLTGTAQAQEFGRADEMTSDGTAYHVYARTGEATIQVVVLGAVNSGIYEIGANTSLRQLLALTGTNMSGVEGDQRLEFMLRLYRGQGTQSLVYDASLEELLGSSGAIPQLQEGDMLVVEENVKRKFNWVNVLRVVTSAATLILAIDRISN